MSLEPTGSNCFFLEHAKKFHLELRAGGGDLVQEDRAFVCRGELADFVGHRVRERAADVAEKLALQQRLGKGPAGDLDERPGRSRRVGVNGACDQALAGSGLAGDKGSGFAVGNGFDKVKDPGHAIVLPDDIAKAVSIGKGLLQLAVLRQKPLLLKGPLDGQSHIIIDNGLGQVVVRPEFDGLDGGLDRAVAGHQDYHNLRVIGPDVPQQFEAVAVGHGDVRDNQVELGGLEAIDGLGDAGGNSDVVALEFQEASQTVEDYLVVIDQQDARLAVTVVIHG